MHKTRLLTLILLTLCALTPLIAPAETYKVVAMKNCAPTYQGRPLAVGMTISDPKALRENWANASGSKYIKLQGQSDKKFHVITAKSAKSTKSTKSDQSFLATLWNSFIGQKKCSTRAPENELAGGLADNLAQTFYILIPNEPTDEPALQFASNLPPGSFLRCSYTLNGQTHAFDAPLRANAFQIPYSALPQLPPDTDRLPLRLTITYHSPTPNTPPTPLSTSTTLILLPE